MNPTPYLIFPGNCREAVTAYAQIFGGEITMMMTGAEMPGMEVPDDKKDWIMHSMIAFEGGLLMASDDMMGTEPSMAGSWVMMEMPSAEAAQSSFDALTQGGEVKMPYGPTEWAEGFGMVTDRFGACWMISAPGEMP